MKKLTFWDGVVIALLGSVIGSIGFFALTYVFSENCAIRLLISGMAFAYSLYLLSRSQERIGRITVVFSWLMFLAAAWLIDLPLALFLIFHVLAIWLTRSLYCYAGLISTLADLGLNALSTASALWALHHSGSLFLTFWCFFLVQALFAYIPTGNRRPNNDKAVISDSESDFKRAYQAADSAIRKLSTYN